MRESLQIDSCKQLFRDYRLDLIHLLRERWRMRRRSRDEFVIDGHQEADS